MGKFKKVLKLPLQAKITSSKNFNYVKGTVNLDFGLKLDKETLKDFLECLNKAVEDVSAELKNL